MQLLRASVVGAGIVCAATSLSAQATADLTAELAEVDAQVADAETLIAQYDGGLIRTLAEARREALLLSRTLLENRIHAAEGRGVVEIVVPAVEPDAARAAQILDEMTAAEARLAQAEDEAALTSGGLIQGLALSRVETEKLALAQLRMGYLQAKYGIAFPIEATSAGPAEERSAEPTEAATEAVAGSSAPVWADPEYPQIDYEQGVFRTAHENGERLSGWWGISSDTAAIDDSAKVIAVNYSAHDPQSFIGNTGLIARCVESETALIFIQPDFLLADFRTNRFAMTLRIDDAPAQDTQWDSLTNNQGAGLFGASAEAFMREIYDADRLLVRLVENNGQRHDAVFELAGAQEAFEAVAAACGWTTLSLSADDYRAIQALLNAGGFDAGTPDGQWGPGSKSALRAFQASVDLPQTGAPDRATLEALGLGGAE